VRRTGEPARAAFREALRLSPLHPDALFYLGSVELRAGRATQALPILEKLVATTPDYPQGRETLAPRDTSSPEPRAHARHIPALEGDRGEAQVGLQVLPRFRVSPRAAQGHSRVEEPWSPTPSTSS